MLYCFHCVGEIEDVQGEYCPHCGQKFSVYYPQSNELPPGTYLNNGRYFVGKSIGEGGFGITYIGFDTKINKKVVIKETFYSGLFQRNCNDRSAADPLKVKFDSSVDIESIMAKTKKECFSLSKAESLNNIVKVYDWFYENNTAYIIIEFINGETLYSKIKRDGRYTYPDLFKHIYPLMQSLSQLHHEGILHRDIKPHNIMLRNTFSNQIEFVLIDFGLARTTQNTTLSTRGVSFSPGYSPFEQRTLSKTDGTYTDVYAMAATIYTALSGEEPSFDMYETVDENFPKLEALRNFDDIPNHVVDTLRYALEPDSRVRCQTLDEFISRLDNKAPNSTISKMKSFVPLIDKNDSRYYSGETIAAHYQDNSLETSHSRNSGFGENNLTRSKYFGDSFNNTRHSVEEHVVNKKGFNFKLIASAAAFIVIVGIIWGLNMKSDVNVPAMVDNEESSEVISSQVSEVQTDTEEADEEEDTSSQTEYVIIPNVYGLKLDTAKDIIVTAGLKYKTVEEESDLMEADHILSQSPAANDKAEKGNVVNLVVAKAKKKENNTSSKKETSTVEVPDVKNLSIGEATSRIEAKGLTAEISSYQNSDTVEKDHVISQTPASGKVNKQTKVQLVVSSGADSSVFKVGNYIGQNIDSVKASLEAEGMRVRYSYTDSNSTGIIMSQSMPSGSKMQKGDVITFSVSQEAISYSTGIFFRNLTCSNQMGGFGKDNVLLFDGNAWSPNNSGGVGEYLTFDTPSSGKSITIYGFIIDIGVTKNNEEFYNNGRPTSLRFEFSDGTSKDVQLSDVMTHQTVYLDRSVNTSSIKITITGSTAGNYSNNPCIGTIVPLI